MNAINKNIALSAIAAAVMAFSSVASAHTPTAAGIGAVAIGNQVSGIASTVGAGSSLSYAMNSQFAQTTLTPVTGANGVSSVASAPGTGTTVAAPFTSATPGYTGQISGTTLTSGQAIAGNISTGSGTGIASSNGAAGAIVEGVATIQNLPAGGVLEGSGASLSANSNVAQATTNEVAGNQSLTSSNFTVGLNEQDMSQVNSVSGTNQTTASTTIQDYTSGSAQSVNSQFATQDLANALFGQDDAYGNVIPVTGVTAGGINSVQSGAVFGAEASGAILTNTPGANNGGINGVGNASQANQLIGNTLGLTALGITQSDVSSIESVFGAAGN
jgi:hypothetical protein